MYQQTETVIRIIAFIRVDTGKRIAIKVKDINYIEEIDDDKTLVNDIEVLIGFDELINLICNK